MYNKIFTKILDSSIWLETDATRIIWLTLIAAMDEDGFVQFACVENLAHRARVELKAAELAIKVLEGPDKNSFDPENEGRRIERVPGGWLVLNAIKYRNIVTRQVGMQRTRERVAKYRAKRKGDGGKDRVTVGNGDVTPSNVSVTPSEAVSEAVSDTNQPSPAVMHPPTEGPEHAIYQCYPKKVGKTAALKAIALALKRVDKETLMGRTKLYAEAVAKWEPHELQYIPHPSTWYGQGRYDDDPSTWERHETRNERRAGWL
jgi:hypothetical protein